MANQSVTTKAIRSSSIPSASTTGLRWTDLATPPTKQLHVIERYHLIENGDVLEANLHIEDPGAFTMPWDAIQRFRHPR
jgi:hypothetical protein